MKTIKFITLILLLSLIISACGEQDAPSDVSEPEGEQTDEVETAEEPVSSEEPAPVEEPAPAEEPPVEEELTEPGAAEISDPSTSGTELTGVLWTLTSLNGKPPLPTTNITAEFNEEGMVGGSASCNSYSVQYDIDGDKIKIPMGAAAMTLMACLEPAMAQETAYLEAMESATTFEVNENNLILYDYNGAPVVTFTSVSQGLGGTSWDVIGYNNGKGGVVSVTTGTEITAEFGENGDLLGFAGCNNYFGDYAADGGTISMGPFGTTRKLCPEPEGVMEQENQYLAALETAATYQIVGLNMNMRTSEGATVANFKRIIAQPEVPEVIEEPAGDFTLSPSQISLDTEPLGTSWQAVAIPASPYDQSMPPGPVGMPAHIQILFGGITDPNDVTSSDPIMYIIPVNSYRELWNDAGNDAVAATIQAIQDLNFALPSPAPTSGYPALPYEQIAGVNDISVQVDRAVTQDELNTSSSTQDGYRFVGRWAQDANLVSNHGPRYVYQGFTNDGVHLVSFWWPVTTAALPDAGEITDEQMEAFYADPSAAIGRSVEELNALSTDQWDPDLAALDAVVASLQIEGAVAAGLVDKTWQWTEGPDQPGSSEIVKIDDPSKYQVTFGSDGTIAFAADCNSGSMSYELSSAGMTGSMLAQPGPVTLAMCLPGSFSDSFIASLQAAQSYRVWAGGDDLELELPAGGGTLLLRDANAPDAPASEDAAISGMVTNMDAALIAEGATATIQIQDTSRMDVAATVIGEQVIENPGQFPIAYQVAYDPGEIVDNHTYSMSTRITAADGSLLFINDTSIPVITRGSPADEVEIPVIQIGG